MSWLVLILCMSAPLALSAQGTAELHGVVRDAKGGPVAAIAVLLTSGNFTRTALTDESGKYRFEHLAAGVYTASAAEAKSSSVTLAADESRTLDLTIAPPQPAFFDQPSFVVAGVSDPSLHGGHGSDPGFRSAEALSKATDSLRTAAPASPTPQELREAIAREPLRADLHRALAEADENNGDALNAAREYQRAAELQGTETNLFDWGADLLKHHAAEQAGEVFARGVRLYPRSTRMLLGLAVSLYSRGSYDQAGRRFFEATDLNPQDPVPYLFLGRLPAGTITDSGDYVKRMARFAELHPSDAQADYDYAVCLWRRGNSAESQALLEKAVAIDPHLGRAWLQLGIALAQKEQFDAAISAYEKAAAAEPSLEEAHYRLAQLWQKKGDAAKARAEIALYRQSSREASRTSERERSEIQEFVFSLRDAK